MKVCLPVLLCHTGNMESLKHGPKSRKIDIYKTLQNFRLKYYLPQYVTLAVQSEGIHSQYLTIAVTANCAIIVIKR